MDGQKFLNNSNFVWMSPVLFTVIIILATLHGFLKGWKSALFYFVGDLIGWIIGVFVSLPILKAIGGTIHVSNFNVETFISEHKAIAPLFMVVWIPIIRVIFGFAHFFVRKRLRVTAGKNESIIASDYKTKKFFWNTKDRVIGAGISLLGVMPFALFSANATSLVSGKPLFNGADKVINILTFGKYDGIAGYAADFEDMAKTINNKGVETLQQIFSGEKIDQNTFTDNRDNLNNLLQSNSLIPVLKSLDPDKLKVDQIQSNIDNLTPLDDDKKFEISASKFADIKDVLISRYGWSTLTSQGGTDAAWLNIQQAFFKITN